MPKLVLSAIDILWPRQAMILIPRLEQLGYHRFWATEHHSAFQSGSPILMAAIAAGMCQRMRIGTAGIMLKLRSSIRVAEEIRLLENLFPGRIDLGLVGAMPPEPIRAELLAGRPEVDDEGYVRKIKELMRMVDPSNEMDSANDRLVGPPISTAPEIWLCGTSRKTAEMAARLGANFAFHDHSKDRDGMDVDGRSVIDAYLQSYREAAGRSHPHFSVVCYGMCAELEKEALAQWFPAIGLSPNFLGSPDQCRNQLLEIRHRYATDELVVQSIGSDITARLDSYSLLKEALSS